MMRRLAALFLLAAPALSLHAQRAPIDTAVTHAVGRALLAGPDTVHDTTIVTRLRVDTLVRVRVDTLYLAPKPVPVPAPASLPDSAVLGAPELPRVRVALESPATGRVLRVAAGGNLQAALDSARGGDRIRLAPGATYAGNYTIRPRASTSALAWLVVATDSAAVPLGARVTPVAALAARYATLTTPNSTAALQVMPGAAYVRVEQVAVTAAPNVASAGVLLNIGYGGAPQSTLADVPSHITLDRVYVHADSALDLRRCVAAHGAYVAIVNSDLRGCHALANDAQAVGAWNGPGPYRVENNYLEGSGENVMFGGGTPGIKGMIPADIEIRRNWITKPLAWKGVYQIKNLVELKAARRVLIEANVLENSWVAAQSGTAFNLKSSTVSADSTDDETAHVTVRWNLVRNVAGGLSVAPNPDGPAIAAHDVRFEQNVFYNVGSANGTANGRMLLLLSGVRNLAFVNNTFLHNISSAPAIVFDGLANRPGSLVFTGNVITGYGRTLGIQGSGHGAGYLSLPYFWPSWSFTGNALVGWDASYEQLPGNDYPAALIPPATGLSDLARLVLAPGQGADVAAVLRATAGVVVP